MGNVIEHNQYACGILATLQRRKARPGHGAVEGLSSSLSAILAGLPFVLERQQRPLDAPVAEPIEGERPVP